jgi:hypothetical protein
MRYLQVVQEYVQMSIASNEFQTLAEESETNVIIREGLILTVLMLL